MAITKPEVTSVPPAVSSAEELSKLYREGIIAGIIGAATIAIWFLLVDVVNGRPLYTPTLLGTALFKRGAGLAALASPESLPIDFEMVLMFSFVHGLTFVVIGGTVSRMLGVAEHNPNIGFGILLLFVVLEFGFVAVNMVFAEAVLRALAWQSVLIGNLLGTAAMAGYFWFQHPTMTINP